MADLATALFTIGSAVLLGAIIEYCVHAIHYGHKKDH
jgi:hypothetical protein